METRNECYHYCCYDRASKGAPSITTQNNPKSTHQRLSIGNVTTEEFEPVTTQPCPHSQRSASSFESKSRISGSLSSRELLERDHIAYKSALPNQEQIMSSFGIFRASWQTRCFIKQQQQQQQQQRYQHWQQRYQHWQPYSHVWFSQRTVNAVRMTWTFTAKWKTEGHNHAYFGIQSSKPH